MQILIPISNTCFKSLRGYTLQYRNSLFTDTPTPRITSDSPSPGVALFAKPISIEIDPQVFLSAKPTLLLLSQAAPALYWNAVTVSSHQPPLLTIVTFLNRDLTLPLLFLNSFNGSPLSREYSL